MGAAGAWRQLSRVRAPLFRPTLVVLAIGVKPEISLARDCGLEIGPCGGIRVDDDLGCRRRGGGPRKRAGLPYMASGAMRSWRLAGPANETT